MRLDILCARQTGRSRRQIKPLLAQGCIQVNAQIEQDPKAWVTGFDRIVLTDEQGQSRLIQPGRPREYWMLHKPAGYISSHVSESGHPTVFELLPEAVRQDVHFVGRLDVTTTGLMLMTSDGQWSKRLSRPEFHMPKVYRVQTESPMDTADRQAFAEGVWLHGEACITRPAALEIINEHWVRLTLHEGRRHQVKRMLRCRHNRVLALHRESMGPLTLQGLAEGSARRLSAEELQAVDSALQQCVECTEK